MPGGTKVNLIHEAHSSLVASLSPVYSQPHAVGFPTPSQPLDADSRRFFRDTGAHVHLETMDIQCFCKDGVDYHLVRSTIRSRPKGHQAAKFQSALARLQIHSMKKLFIPGLGYNTYLTSTGNPCHHCDKVPSSPPISCDAFQHQHEHTTRYYYRGNSEPSREYDRPPRLQIAGKIILFLSVSGSWLMVRISWLADRPEPHS